MDRRKFLLALGATPATVSGCLHGDNETEEEGEDGEGEDTDDGTGGEDGNGDDGDDEEELDQPLSIDIENAYEEEITLSIALEYEAGFEDWEEVYSGEKTIEAGGRDAVEDVAESYGDYEVYASYGDQEASERWIVNEHERGALVVVEPDGELWIST